MLTVATVLKSGGIYDVEWVKRLRNGVGRHLPQPHRFVCLSDIDVPCERIPLQHDWPGWWSKIELFKLRGPLVYFDLDTAIVGDLTDIAQWAAEKGMSVLQDFYRVEGFGSGILTWNSAAHLDYIYETFADRPEDIMASIGRRGDQGFLEDEGIPAWRLQPHLPGQIVSYKVHCLAGIPAGARVVALHGRPKFADMPANDPVRLAWEAAA